MVISRNNYRKRNKSSFRLVKIIICLVIIGVASYCSFSYINSQYQIQKEKQIALDKKKAEEAAAAAKEAKRKEPVYITLPGAQPVRAIVEDYSLNSSIWKIVNKTFSIPLEYIPEPLIIPNVATNTEKSDEERSVRTDIADPLKTMFDAASTFGYQLMIGSGYRSSSLQAYYFDSLSASVGEEEANISTARPGQSEHQTGLAVDISTVSRECYLDECFADTDDGKWLENNSYLYGFILRYPEGKESITGYMYESWHFRYVGIELATAIHDSGLTYDEAWTYIETALNTLINNGAVVRP